MAILSVRNLNKTFIENEILRDISFHVEEGDRIGLVGDNGSGKTTLFKILSNNESYDSGDIYIQGSMEPSYLEQHTYINSDNSIFEESLSVFESVFDLEKKMKSLEDDMDKYSSDADKLKDVLDRYMDLQERYEKIGGASVNSRVRGVLKGLGFDESEFSKSINYLSGGQKSRVELAKLLLADRPFMLLDEPTNHLDIQALSWLESYLNTYKGTYMIISHDRFFLDRTVNRIFLLENKSLTIYEGNYSDFIPKRQEELEVLKHQYESQQAKLKKEEELIDRYLSSGKKNIYRQGASRKKRLEKLIEEHGLLDPIEEKKTANISFKSNIKAGNIIFQAQDLSKSYSNKVFENISFEVRNGDRIGIIGENGVGKTSLLKILAGLDEPDSGTLKEGSNLEIGYFDQEMSDLGPNKMVIDEIWDAYPRLTHYEIRSYLARMNFVGDEVLDEIRILSGGEKSRVSLLKLMMTGSNVLLLDEPTNHLDIKSKETLETSLKDFDGTVIAISHDRYFLNNFADKIWEMTSRGINEYLGDYDYYISKKESLENKDENLSDLTETQKQKIQKEKRDKKRQEQKLNKEIKNLEEKIERLEAEIDEIDQELFKPEIASDYKKALELSRKKNQVQKDLDQIYEKWIEYTN